MDDASDEPIRVMNGDRVLAVQWWGDPEGHPVFLMHGMPGSRIGPRPRGIMLERMGIKLISYDRPGYGMSDRHPGRTVASAGEDVERIATELGIEKFAVVGRSGGGPHALACAARLPNRVQRVAVLVSPAPPDAAGLDWSKGMGRLNTDDFADVDRDIADASAGATPEAVNLALRAAAIREDPDSLIRHLQPELSATDRRFVEDRAIRNLLLATYTEAVREGSSGWIDDAVALRSPWDFKFGDVLCPVLLWHGGEDRFAPASHTVWMAERLRSARGRLNMDEIVVQIDEGVAHFGAFEVFPEVLTWLIDPHRIGVPSLVRKAINRSHGDLGHRRATLPRSDAPVRPGSPAGQ
jgi:pimeloyl-ACP methyl ester carboxylesterase